MSHKKYELFFKGKEGNLESVAVKNFRIPVIAIFDKRLTNKTLNNILKWNMKTSVISINPQIMAGEPVFIGTRVPIRALMDYLIEDGNYEDFLIGFPQITREMVTEVLKELTQRGIPKAKRPKIIPYETAA